MTIIYLQIDYKNRTYSYGVPFLPTEAQGVETIIILRLNLPPGGCVRRYDPFCTGYEWRLKRGLLGPSGMMAGPVSDNRDMFPWLPGKFRVQAMEDRRIYVRVYTCVCMRKMQQVLEANIFWTSKIFLSLLFLSNFLHYSNRLERSKFHFTRNYLYLL